MRQVRLLGLLGRLGLLGQLGLVGRGETPRPNWLATVCGFCHNSLDRHYRLNDAGEARRNRLNVAGQARHNRLSVAGKARPAVLGEVPCV